MTTTYTANILDVFSRATDSDILEGKAWYAYAHDIACEATDVRVGAGILSALSPRMPWDRNVTLARMAFSAPLTGGALGMSIAKVNLIRDGVDPTVALGKGLKTLAFFDNILNPATTDAVTVDTHAIKIAGVNRDSVGKGLYNEIADSYREAANKADIDAIAMQAITWITWRREKGIK